MILGILSDTHGHWMRSRTAAELFVSRGVGFVIHCGDIGGAAVLHEMYAVLQPAGVGLLAVLGNSDAGDVSLQMFPDLDGLRLAGRFGRTECAGRRIAVLHGDDERALHEARHGGGFDYVFTGHTHEPADDRTGPARMINPGALRYAERTTVAIVDLQTGRCSFETLT